jgi:hypothetical protein
MLSKQDKLLMDLWRLVKKCHWKNNVTRRGERWTHTFWDKWTCANGRVILRQKQSPRYRIEHGWKDEYGSWFWILLKLLMHPESRGALFFFFLFFFIHIHIFLLSFFFLSSFILFSFSLFFPFLYSPWTLDNIVPTSCQLPPCLDDCTFSGK